MKRHGTLGATIWAALLLISIPALNGCGGGAPIDAAFLGVSDFVWTAAPDGAAAGTFTATVDSTGVLGLSASITPGSGLAAVAGDLSSPGVLSLSYTYAAEGTYEATLTVSGTRIDDGHAVTASASLPGIEVGDTPLAWVVEAQLSRSPAAAGMVAPVSVSLDASGSSEKAASAITGFDWDLDGNGSFEVADGGASRTILCDQPGSYDAMVKVYSNLAQPPDDTATTSWTVSNPVSLTPAKAAAAVLEGGAPLGVVLTAAESRTAAAYPGDAAITVSQLVWDFDGDGINDETVNSPQPEDLVRTHEYTDSSASGHAGTEYSPTVTVTYSYAGAEYSYSATTSIKAIGPDILLVPPTALCTVNPDPPTGIAKPATVTMDASASYDGDNYEAGATPPAPGSEEGITKYEFTYDINAVPTVWADNGADPTFDFLLEHVGLYNLGCRVTDDDSPSQQHECSVVAEVVAVAPSADLQASPTLACGDSLTVNFDASASGDPDGDIADYQWDFDGDGEFGASSADPPKGSPEERAAQGDNSPSCHYSGYQSTTASVKVIDDDAETSVASVQIVLNEPPTAVLLADTYFGAPPLMVHFGAGNSTDPTLGGGIDDYIWDLDGDGNFDESPSESAFRGLPDADCSFPSSGTYHPAVTVVDQDGCEDIATVDVVVNNPPSAALATAPDPATGTYDLDVQFDASGSTDADSGIAHYQWDFDGDGVYGEAGAEAAANDDNTPQHTFTQEELQVSNGQAQPVTVSVKVTDNQYDAGPPETGAGYASVQVGLLGFPPSADFSVDYDPLNPDHDAALDITVDPSGSHDDLGEPGNSGISAYFWDWGDGTTDSFNNDNPVNHSFSYPGDAGELVRLTPPWSRTITLTVTDVDGLQDTMQVEIDLHGWRRITAATGNGNDVGAYSSMHMVDQLPALAYYDATAGSLMYKRANAALPVVGGDWTSSPLLVDDGYHDDDPGNRHAVGAYCVLFMTDADSTPSIAYYDATAQRLCYIRANDPLGASWPSDPMFLDGSVKGFISAAVINFNPALTYITTDGGEKLRYIRATDTTGDAAWNVPVTVYSPGGPNALEYSSLASVNGRPGVCFRDVDNDDLLFCRASNADGTAWGAPVFVFQNATGVLQDPDLAIVDGFPAVAYSNYIDEDRRNVFYLRADDANGANWDYANDLVVVGTGRYPSLAQSESGALPWVSFYQITDPANGGLAFAYLDPNWYFTDGWGRTAVGPESLKAADPVQDCGQNSTLLPVEVDGAWRPAISYYNETLGDLLFTVYN